MRIFRCTFRQILRVTHEASLLNFHTGWLPSTERRYTVSQRVHFKASGSSQARRKFCQRLARSALCSILHFSSFLFDDMSGSACCLENMCLSLVQLLQLPDCPANIVQDASRYRYSFQPFPVSHPSECCCSLLDAYMLHCAGVAHDKESNSKMEQPLRLFQHRVDNLKTFATAVCSKLQLLFSKSDLAEVSASAAAQSVHIQENYELRNQLDSLNSDYMQLLHQSKTLEDSEASLKLELERVKRRVFVQGEAAHSTGTTPAGSSSTPQASTQENTAWKAVAEKR